MSNLGVVPRKQSIGEDTQPQKIVVGVAGGSAAGKTTLCENIYRQMAFDRNFKVEIISLDSFYKNVNKSEVDITQYNFDHPNALDFDLAYKTLVSLIESSEPVPIPQYSFIEHARMKEPSFAGPANIIFFEGLMAFYDKRIRDLFTYKIFIHCDDDIRLCRRLKRDTTERGRSVVSVLEQYNKFVKNAFRDFILPSSVYADIIIPGFRNNRVSVDFIVQHIKNMARRITFKERAVKTRTFIFGESQIYDLEASNSYDIKVNLEQESFLVFPTSSEHRKELEFFLNCLLSQMFSVEYFHEVYIHQFLKVLKVLLSQLITLKSFKHQQMEIFSVEHIREVLSRKSHHPIKVVFFPVAERQHAKGILSQVKDYIAANPGTTFIILNAFCDMNVPQMIYRLRMSSVIMINLFVLANDKRFRQIMSNNIEVTSDNFDWFVHDPFIAQQAVSIISRQFHLHTPSALQIGLFHYQSAIQSQSTSDKPVVRVLDYQKESVGIMKQYEVYPQKHGNLCGYHALNTILCLQSKQDPLSEEIFVQNYRNLSRQGDYQPLERHQIETILSSATFQGIENVALLFFSFKYFQNTEEQNLKLQLLFDQLGNSVRSYFYVVLGIHNHYVLTKISPQEISFYDSTARSLRNICNDVISNEEKERPDFKDALIHQRDLKEVLQILLQLLSQKTTVPQTMVQKIMEDVVESFNIIQDNAVEVEKWLCNQYPKEVLESQLLKPLRQKKVGLDQAHTKMLQGWLDHPRIKELFKDKQTLIVI